ncbi:MAG: substrate-binding domain-containing protein, partial [Oscillospiraceae bacterium]
SGEVLRLVESRDLDVGFARGEIHSEHLEKVLISEDQVSIVAAKPFTLAQLGTMPRIDFVREGNVVRQADRWWKENFDAPPVVRMRLNSCQQCLAMVKRNLGYGIISDRKFFQMEHDLFVYPLAFRNGEPLISKTWIIYHRDSAYNPILRNFLNFAQEVDINHLD